VRAPVRALVLAVSALCAGAATAHAASPESAPAPVAPAAPAAPAAAPESAPAAGGAAAEGLLVLAGRVLEAGTRVPISSAEIVLKGTALAASTDEGGRFRLAAAPGDAPPAGDLHVTVSVPGYVALELTETVADAAKRDRVVYYLRRDAAAPMKSTVRDKAPIAETTVRTLSTAEISAIPGASDPVRALSTMPGVARAPLGVPFLIVRGSEPRDTVVFVEGHPIPILYHLIGFDTTVNQDVLSGLEFYPGAVPPRYGRGHGGAVELRLRDDVPRRWAAHIQTDTLATSFGVEVPLGPKMGLYLSGARSYIDAELRAVWPLLRDAGVDLGLVVAPRYYDYAALFIARPAAGHVLRVMWFGSDDRAALVDPDANLIRAVTFYHRGLITYRARLAGGLTNDVSLSIGFSRLSGGYSGAINVKLDNLDLALREEIVAPLAPTLAVAVGLDFLLSRPSWDLFINGGLFDDSAEGDIFTLKANEIVPDFAAYVEGRWEPVKGLRILPGLRMDYYFLAQDGAVDPRLSARWKVHEMVTVKASAGRYGEPPSTFDTGVGPDRAVVAPSWSFQWTAGVEVRPLPRLSLDVELFEKELYGLTNGGFSNTGGTGREMTTGDVFDPSLRTARGRVIGLEALLRLDPGGPLYGWIAYTLSKADRWDGAVPGSPHEPADFDQRHVLAVVAALRAGRGWSFGLRFRLSSGNFYTLNTRGPWSADDDTWTAIPGERLRFPPFNSLDLRAEKSWVFDTWAFKFYVEVLNVYNSKNSENITYSDDYSESRLTRGLPIIPRIGARADF
jgi:hypothetical protein